MRVLLESVTVLRFSQSQNAKSPIEVTLGVIFILVRLIQLINAVPWIEVTLAGIVI